MTKQTSLFDLYAEPLATPIAPVPTGESLKRQGMAAARDAKADAVGYARELAYDIARSRADRTCHMALVNEALAAEGKPGLGNAAGSVFATNVWEFTGQRVKDTRAHAHSNEIKVWRLRHHG
jgi:hypothetical protein